MQVPTMGAPRAQGPAYGSLNILYIGQIGAISTLGRQNVSSERGSEIEA